MAPNPPELSTDDMIKHIFAAVNRIEATQAEHKVRITECEAKIEVLDRQVYELRNIVNMREQEQRNMSIRISGFPLLDDEKASTDAKFLAKKIYEKALYPVLAAAKAKNDIDKIPTLNNTIASCYRVGANFARANTATPPPLVIKLQSEHVRMAILKNKRLSTPSPTDEEKAMGLKKMIIMEDLTPACYKLLRDLQRSEEVQKAWTVEGRIRFLLTGSQTIHKVKSVFDSASGIIEKAKNG
jgi:hypothetical protein